MGNLDSVSNIRFFCTLTQAFYLLSYRPSVCGLDDL
jgi:hypothetical protein